MTMAAPVGSRRRTEIIYPTSDGKPLGETDFHVDLTLDSKAALRAHYAHRADVYVAANNFIYYEEGNTKACVSPDCYVVFGVPGHNRDCYKAWEEDGKLPNIVIEFSSRKTRHEDTGRKRELYEKRLRVPEYFLFDPKDSSIRPRLQGFRMIDGRYVSLLPVDGRIYSEQLDLYLVPEEKTLRFFDAKTGEYLRSYPEEKALRIAFEAKAHYEVQLTRRETDRADAAEQFAKLESEKAKAAEQSAKLESEKAKAAQTENAQLQKELEALRKSLGL